MGGEFQTATTKKAQGNFLTPLESLFRAKDSIQKTFLPQFRVFDQ
jgi:hypothetical protein